MSTINRATVDLLTVVDTVLAPVLPAGFLTTWRAVFAAISGQPMSGAEADLYRRCTGRQALPVALARELWMVIGRRGGKSFAAAVLAVYAACFRRYRLGPGERGTVVVIAADRRQARVIFRYIVGLLDAVPMLSDLVVGRTKESIDLSNGIVIEIHTASFRAVRGYTIVAAILDEIAFWPTDEAAEPDTEILNAIRPAMATVQEPLLVALSSPYARRGELWRAYRDHFGKDNDPVLVWKADTRTMHPSIDPTIIERAYAEDEARARAEYGAEFRTDVESFVRIEAVDACTVPGRIELPPLPGVQYVAFVDPSGGSADSMTLAIAHEERGAAVLDLVREIKPPFSPEAAVEELTGVCKRYRISEVTGDRYAGEWPRERFRKQGINYEISDRVRSDLYRELLPAINSRGVELLDLPRLRAQLVALERRTGRGGRDAIDHAPGSHDDVINAAAGALVLAAAGVRERPHVFVLD